MASARPGPVRVLVVDDSAFARSVITRQLSSDPGVTVIGHARDGVEALEQARALNPDVITLDVTMPRMDGLEALRQIMQERPTPTVMVSALTREGAEVTLEALELGAVDFVLKPGTAGILARGVEGELVGKVKLAAAAQLTPRGPRGTPAPASRRARDWKHRVVVIAASTGGPAALATVIQGLPPDTGVPILIVQHMPSGFTASLARRLDQISAVHVEEAHTGQRLQAGLVLVAPGGRHTEVTADLTVALSDGPAERGVRPSANVTMASVATAAGAATLGVVLTGMGTDGTRGAALVRSAGGDVIAESEETCVVYGMPRSVIDAGLASAVVPIGRIAQEVVRRSTRALPARAAT